MAEGLLERLSCKGDPWAWPRSLTASFPSLEHHGAWDLFPPLQELRALCPALSSAERGRVLSQGLGVLRREQPLGLSLLHL